MKIILMTSFFAFAVSASAQVSIQASGLNPTPGETFTVKSANWISEGNSGNNITWDLSSMQPNADITISHATTSLFSPSNIKQTTTVATQSTIGYLDANANGQFYYGMDAGSTIITYQTPMKVLSYPLNNTVYETNNFAATFTSSGYAFTRSGTVQLFADSWGTLITPSGTFTDVIRVRITQNFVDTYSMGSFSYNIVTYAWYKAGVHYSLASTSISSNSVSSTQYSAQYLTNVNVGLDNNTLTVMSLYPNPTDSKLNIVVDNVFDLEQVEVYALDGQKVLTKEISNSSSLIQLDLNEVQPGTYILQLRGRNNSVLRREKFVKL